MVGGLTAGFVVESTEFQNGFFVTEALEGPEYGIVADGFGQPPADEGQFERGEQLIGGQLLQFEGLEEGGESEGFAARANSGPRRPFAQQGALFEDRISAGQDFCEDVGTGAGEW